MSLSCLHAPMGLGPRRADSESPFQGWQLSSAQDTRHPGGSAEKPMMEVRQSRQLRQGWERQGEALPPLFPVVESLLCLW